MTSRKDLGPRPCRKCGEMFSGVRCMPCTRKKNMEWYYSDRGRQWYKNAQRRQNRHGLTMAEADKLIEEQEGKCAACGGLPSNVDAPRSRLVIDHDHITGEVRGALCNTCNLVLGMVSDDPERLHSLINYLGYVH